MRVWRQWREFHISLLSASLLQLITVPCRSHQFDNEVSCLDIFSHGGQTVAVVALWTVNTVHLVALPSFEVLTTQAIDTTFLVRSVLLATFSDNTTHLFAGLGDGTLTSYGVDTSNFSLIAGTEKTVTIGTKPVTVYSFAPKGVVNVFASSDRPTIISRAGDRLVYSSVNLKVCSRVDFRCRVMLTRTVAHRKSLPLYRSTRPPTLQQSLSPRQQAFASVASRTSSASTFARFLLTKKSRDGLRMMRSAGRTV